MFSNSFNTNKYKEIQQNVLDIIDPATNKIVFSWGADK